MDKQVQDWLNAESSFIKIKVGEKYEGLFQKMEFDATGGYQGKATVKYFLKDLKDGKIRSFSSSSKSLAQTMMKMIEGDRLIISGLLNEKEQKTYNVVRISDKQGEKDEDLNKIPF